MKSGDEIAGRLLDFAVNSIKLSGNLQKRLPESTEQEDSKRPVHHREPIMRRPEALNQGRILFIK